MKNVTDLLPAPVRPWAKALVAAAAGGLVVAYAALADGAVDAQEWVAIVLGVLGVGGATYGARNDG